MSPHNKIEIKKYKLAHGSSDILPSHQSSAESGMLLPLQDDVATESTSLGLPVSSVECTKYFTLIPLHRACAQSSGYARHLCSFQKSFLPAYQDHFSLTSASITLVLANEYKFIVMSIFIVKAQRIIQCMQAS